MTRRYELSVVVATYNRREVLRTTIERLANQTLATERFEVIVVDDGSGDGTGDMVRSLAATSALNLRYLHHENRGPGHTQNRGIEHAASDLVVLIADDIWAEPGFLQAHLDSHRAHPEERVAVLGEVRQSKALPPGVMNQRWDPFAEEYGKMHAQLERGEAISCLCFFACNISLKKHFMQAHGMFVERRGAACEDLELGYRLGQHGLRLIYNPHASARHHHPVTIEQACRREFERGRNLDLLLERVPPAVVFRYCNLPTHEAGAAYLVKSMIKAALRAALFNGATVRHLWLPLLVRAEVSRWAALFARRRSYSGVLGYHIRKGYRSLRMSRRRGQSARVEI